MKLVDSEVGTLRYSIQRCILLVKLELFLLMKCAAVLWRFIK
jgi:hypothetical protein